MMKFKQNQSLFFTVLAVAGIVFGFQNCSRVGFSDVPLDNASELGVNDIPAVDIACENPTPSFNFYPPFTELKPPELDAKCRNGFEMNNLTEGSLTLNAILSAQQHRAFVEVATYLAPDNTQISAIDSAGNKKVLFHNCLMQTWDAADPTEGLVRPPDQTIRQFRILIPAGTKKLVIDNSNAKTPTYIRLAGLCDFDTAASSVSWSSGAVHKRYLPGSY